MEGNANGNGLGEASWAGADGDRNEHTIKSGMTLRKTIRHHRDSGRVGSDVLHAPHHRVSAEYKGFTEGLKQTETDEPTHCGTIVPIRTVSGTIDSSAQNSPIAYGSSNIGRTYETIRLCDLAYEAS